MILEAKSEVIDTNAPYVFISLLDSQSKINLKQQGLSHWKNITYYFRVTIELHKSWKGTDQNVLYFPIYEKVFL